MYVLYKIIEDKKYCWGECDVKVDVKLIAPFSCESEASRICHIMNKENQNESITYKYGYLKDYQR
jgi:hypothetical protein